LSPNSGNESSKLGLKLDVKILEESKLRRERLEEKRADTRSSFKEREVSSFSSARDEGIESMLGRCEKSIGEFSGITFTLGGILFILQKTIPPF
jgi:hypothetical protein